MRRKEENGNSRPISLSRGEIVDQYSQLRSNKTLSLSLCPVKEAVGEGHWQVISIPAGSAYSGVGSRIISFWSYRSIAVSSARRPALPGCLRCCSIQSSTTHAIDGPLNNNVFYISLGKYLLKYIYQRIASIFGHWEMHISPISWSNDHLITPVRIKQSDRIDLRYKPAAHQKPPAALSHSYLLLQRLFSLHVQNIRSVHRWIALHSFTVCWWWCKLWNTPWDIHTVTRLRSCGFSASYWAVISLEMGLLLAQWVHTCERTPRHTFGQKDKQIHLCTQFPGLGQPHRQICLASCSCSLFVAKLPSLLPVARVDSADNAQ